MYSLLVVYQDVDNLALPSANMKATFRLGNKIFSFLETLSRLFLEDCHEGMVLGEDGRGMDNPSQIPYLVTSFE